MRTSAVPIHIECVKVVIIVVNPETHETTLPRIDPFAVNRAYYNLLRQEISGKPVITSVEEIDDAITIFT
jgi:hypothetical protein